MSLRVIASPSPNFDSRDGQAVDMLVLHYTGMQSAREALDRLCCPAAKVSAHYMVEEDGAVHALVEEGSRAWHAGVSCWRGAANVNQRSVGIEIVNPGHEFGYRAFPASQMRAVEQLCRGILERHAIPPRNVVGHSDVAPARKEDPGERFDWQALAAQGIGHWPAPGTAPGTPPAPLARLADYGYDLTVPDKAVTAFQRHFRPRRLSGLWDEECGQLLAALLRMG